MAEERLLATSSIAEAATSTKPYSRMKVFLENPLLGSILDHVLDVIADKIRSTDDDPALIEKIILGLDNYVDMRNNTMTEVMEYSPEDYET